MKIITTLLLTLGCLSYGSAQDVEKRASYTFTPPTSSSIGADGREVISGYPGKLTVCRSEELRSHFDTDLLDPILALPLPPYARVDTQKWQQTFSPNKIHFCKQGKAAVFKPDARPTYIATHSIMDCVGVLIDAEDGYLGLMHVDRRRECVNVFEQMLDFFKEKQNVTIVLSSSFITPLFETIVKSINDKGLNVSFIDVSRAEYKSTPSTSDIKKKVPTHRYTTFEQIGLLPAVVAACHAKDETAVSLGKMINAVGARNKKNVFNPDEPVQPYYDPHFIFYNCQERSFPYVASSMQQQHLHIENWEAMALNKS